MVLSKEWEVIDGTLHRNQIRGENKRLFYKDPSFKNALIRFEFKFDGAQDIRLVTGSNGNYNAVVHIKKDHFFIQTAMDKRGPWFPMRHGECAYSFETGKWYVMTVEFYEDQVIAHLDREQLAYGKHPMINQERTYLALQVDQAGACFDNIQVFGAAVHSSHENNLQLIDKQSGKFPFAKTDQDEYKILKGNLHAILYMKDPKYQKLVGNVEEIDLQKKAAFSTSFCEPQGYSKENSIIEKEAPSRRFCLQGNTFCHSSSKPGNRSVSCNAKAIHREITGLKAKSCPRKSSKRAKRQP